MELLTRDFFDRDTVQVARELLGKQLVRVLEDGTELVCSITETEAYVGPSKPPKREKRNDYRG